MERENRAVREPRGTRVVQEDVEPDLMGVETAAAGAIARDPITWGPIWAGVLTAFGLFLLFSVLALAGGMALIDFGDPPAAGDVPVDLVASIVSGLFLVVAFFAGGFTASWSGGLIDSGRGILHGFLVWALALVLLLVFAALGLGQVFGAAGEIFAGPFAPGGLPNVDMDAEQLAQAVRDASWATVFAIVLAMASAVLGGLVGTMDAVNRRWSEYTRRGPR